MKPTGLLGLLALALTAPASGQGGASRMGGREGDGPPRMAYANPSAGIAADIELARLAGDKKGRWHALRQAAAPDAVMFVPRMVLAQVWLKNRSAPAPVLKLRPARAWASCDGSLILTSGARQDGAKQGWYTTVWQRQPDGDYRWTFTQEGPAAAPLEDPDMIEARVAQCPASRPPAPATAPSPKGKREGKRDKAPLVLLDPARHSGRSRDGSLVWDVTVDPAGARHFIARMLAGGEMRTVRDERVEAAGSL